jgi:hypothetical protein
MGDKNLPGEESSQDNDERVDPINWFHVVTTAEGPCLLVVTTLELVWSCVLYHKIPHLATDSQQSQDRVSSEQPAGLGTINMSDFGTSLTQIVSSGLGFARILISPMIESRSSFALGRPTRGKTWHRRGPGQGGKQERTRYLVRSGLEGTLGLWCTWLRAFSREQSRQL